MPGQLLVEVIGSHTCTGHYRAEVPHIVQHFAAETGAEIVLRAYRAWDTPARGGADTSRMGEVPEHVRRKLFEIRAGQSHSSGFFLNGEWLPLSPHHAGEAAAVRQALLRAAGLRGEPPEVQLSARALDKVQLNARTVSSIRMDDNSVAQLGASCNQFERVWFFDGTIKHLSVASAVEAFRYLVYHVQGVSARFAC